MLLMHWSLNEVWYTSFETEIQREHRLQDWPYSAILRAGNMIMILYLVLTIPCLWDEISESLKGWNEWARWANGNLDLMLRMILNSLNIHMPVLWKKCWIVAICNMPVFLMFTFSCSFDCCIMSSLFVESTAMSLIILFPSSRSQNPEVGEHA